MKISITIEADSVDEAKKACGQLMINEHVYTLAPAETPAAPKEEKPAAKTTKKAAAEPVAPPTAVAPTGDPLSSTPAPVSDPLSSTPATPAADPLAATPATPAADPLGASAPAQSASVTLATIREKIGTLTEKKQKVKDLVATYKKADGTPCEKPSDLQEKDYQDVLNDLDYV